MTGFEYAAAGLMVQEGMPEEGERMIAAVRERYDGKKRNPFNEIECVNNYSRSMAAFALLPIYAGLLGDAARGYLRVKPAKPGAFAGLWFLGGAWGAVELDAGARFAVEAGELRIRELELPFIPKEIEIDGAQVPFHVAEGRAVLDETATARHEMKARM